MVTRLGVLKKLGAKRLFYPESALVIDMHVNKKRDVEAIDKASHRLNRFMNVFFLLRHNRTSFLTRGLAGMCH